MLQPSCTRINYLFVLGGDAEAPSDDDQRRPGHLGGPVQRMPPGEDGAETAPLAPSGGCERPRRVRKGLASGGR